MILIHPDSLIRSIDELHTHLTWGLFDSSPEIGEPLRKALGDEVSFALMMSAMKHAAFYFRDGIPFHEATNGKELLDYLESYFPRGFIEACKSGAVTFYTDKAYWADNFSAFAISKDNLVYPTVEHAYQAAKFDAVGIRSLIWRASSPHQAKELAHDPDFVPHIRATWQEEKVDVMLKLLLLKVSQHDFVKKKLLATGTSLLVKDSPTDNFWGRGPAWDGHNMLGRIWMAIRDYIRIHGDGVDVRQFERMVEELVNGIELPIKLFTLSR
jgi:ribA/ribD-fused uncharacterized protein